MIGTRRKFLRSRSSHARVKKRVLRKSRRNPRRVPTETLTVT